MKKAPACKKCNGTGFFLAFKRDEMSQTYAFKCGNCYNPNTINFPDWKEGTKENFISLNDHVEDERIKNERDRIQNK